MVHSNEYCSHVCAYHHDESVSSNMGAFTVLVFEIGFVVLSGMIVGFKIFLRFISVKK